MSSRSNYFLALFVAVALGVVAYFQFVAKSFGPDSPIAESMGPVRVETMPAVQLPSGNSATSSSSSAQAKQAETSSPTGSSKSIQSAQVFDHLPRGLGASFLEVNQTSDGDLAYAVAKALKVCQDIEVGMENFRKRSSEVKDQKILALMRKDFDDRQQTYSQCQTIQVDYQDAQRQMLQVAVDKGVVGAAAELVNAGNQTPLVRRAVVRDASAGHLLSISLLASGNPSEFSLTADQQAEFQAALLAAARRKGQDSAENDALHFAQRWYAINLAKREPTESNIAAAREAWDGKGQGTVFEALPAVQRAGPSVSRIVDAMRRQHLQQ